LDECQLNRTSVKSGLYFIFNPIKGRKWNVGAEQYGKIWQAGDIIGCMLDINDKTCSKYQLKIITLLLYIFPLISPIDMFSISKLLVSVTSNT
jgi:hypothetical protein